MKDQRQFIPCRCKTQKECSCLFSSEENNTAIIYKRHRQKSCSNKNHSHLKSNGYYLVEKPVWKNHCWIRLSQKEKNVLETLTELICTCTTKRACLNCNFIFLNSNFIEWMDFVPNKRWKFFKLNIQVALKVNESKKKSVSVPRFFSCNCLFKRFCKCISEEERKNLILKKHVPHSTYYTCKQKTHTGFLQGYYAVESRPIWKNACRLTLNEYQIAYLETKCQENDLNCTCVPKKKCNLCLYIVKYNKLYLDEKNQIDIYWLMKKYLPLSLY
jgi:hypothetical protein